MIKIRKRSGGGWEVDLHVQRANGDRIRERKRLGCIPHGQVKTWAEGRHAHLLQHGKSQQGAEKRMTVADFAGKWLAQRKAEGIANVVVEEQRMRDHVLPELGSMKLGDVKPRHAHQLVLALSRTKSPRGGTLASRTVRGVYFTARQMFTHAVFQELLVGNPFTLPRGMLPKVADKDPLWRPGAVFTTDEVERLISDPVIPIHRRVAYAVEFFTGLRTGQASALRWGDYELQRVPLGRITSAQSWESKGKKLKGTKTGVTHEVPVHPVLAKVLADWRLTGWKKRMGRAPRQEDLIIPTIRATDPEVAGYRDVRKALEDFHEDLDALGLRRRRHYDSRRTFISLGLDGGASKDILQSITHPRPADAFDLYRTPSWEARCEAVTCIKVELREGRLISLAMKREGPTGELTESRVG
jgi:integrase